LLAAALRWARDAFDAMLYALVLALLMRDLGMSKTVAGSPGTLTLLASGIAGVLFGFLADRNGRKHALMASILTYSVCSFASGLRPAFGRWPWRDSCWDGTWAASGTRERRWWPRAGRLNCEHAQRSWALRFAAAALVAGPVARYFGWRAVFFLGILPAVITLWIQRSVPESEMRRERRVPAREDLAAASRDVTSYVSTSFSVIIRAPYVKHTFALLLFNFFGMTAWGTVYSASAVPVAAGGARWTRLRSDGDDHAHGGAESVRMFTGGANVLVATESESFPQGCHSCGSEPFADARREGARTVVTRRGI
jgi:MFS family permease